jgi:zinc transporter
MSDPVKLAFALNGPLAGRALDHAEAAQVLEDEALAWVHLDASAPEAMEWIAEHMPYLDGAVREALVQPSTRSRATQVGAGVLAVLRGLNLNDGKDPEDMVAIRIWVEDERIITLARQPVRALEDIAESIRAGQGPKNAGAFMALLAQRLNARLDPMIARLDVETDALETQVIEAPGNDLRQRIVVMRLQVIELRRHCAPQRDALLDLERCDLASLSDLDRRHLREARDRLTRMVENMDEMRDSLAVLREELSGQLSDRLNRNMHILSVLSAIFPPLGFLTGLLGVNVMGIPGAETPMAFWMVCGGLAVVVLAQLWVLRRLRWI